MPPNFQLIVADNEDFYIHYLCYHVKWTYRFKNAYMIHQEIVLLNLTLCEIHRPNKSSLG